MPLTLDERQAFLAEPHIGALSVSAGPERGPLTVPIWYQYEPGGELWVLTGPESEKMPGSGRRDGSACWPSGSSRPSDMSAWKVR